MAIVELPIKRRRYAGEEKWFPVIERFGPTAFREALIDAGLSPQIAGNLVWFVEDQRGLDRRFDPTTGTRYRRMLAELDPEQVAADLAKRSIPG